MPLAAPSAATQEWPLLCPVCGLDLDLRTRPDGRPSGLECAEGHRYDAARQGHVSLLGGKGSPFQEDTASMVAARERWLETGHYAPLAAALSELAARHAPTGESQDRGQVMLADTGAGTGYYSRAVLDSLQALGHTPRAIDMDLSRAGAQRAAKDPRILSLVWDTWKLWPVASGGIDVLLDVFAPRNPAEFLRVVRPGGVALVATPLAGHLAELEDAAGLLGIDERKEERLAEVFASGWEAAERVEVVSSIEVDREAAADLAHMGPAGHHHSREQMLERMLAGPERRSVSTRFVVHAYRRQRMPAQVIRAGDARPLND